MHRNTVFSQILQLICRYRFKKCVDRYRGDNYTKLFSCWQQLLVLLFAQARGLTSLRDIEVSLRESPPGVVPYRADQCGPQYPCRREHRP